MGVLLVLLSNVCTECGWGGKHNITLCKIDFWL